MWPFERQRDVLRIGKLAVELWGRESGGLVKRRGATIDGSVDLRGAVQSALQGASPMRAPVDVVVESAWIPVVLLEPGPQLLRREQVEALLRHRLARVYDERTEAVANWALQLDHRPGDAYGLGFGLSPSVRAAIEAGVQASGRPLASLQPAMQWARRITKPRDGWWLWLEQDRAVLAWLERGRVTALHAAADLLRDEAAVARLVRIEAARAGVSVPEAPVLLSGWEQPFGMGEGASQWLGAGSTNQGGTRSPARPAGAAA